MERSRWKDVLRATVAALLGAVVLVQPAPAQTFEITLELPEGTGELRMPLLSPNGSVPNLSSEELLGCVDAPATCLDEIWSNAQPPAEAPTAPPKAPQSAPSSAQEVSPASSPPPEARRSRGKRRPHEPPALPAPATTEPRPPLKLRELGPPPPPERAPRPLDVSPRDVQPLPSRPPAMSLGPPAAAVDIDWIRFVATLVLGAGTLSLLLLTTGAAPRSAATRVAYQLADRRREVSLLGGVMVMGVAVGYLTAVFAG